LQRLKRFFYLISLSITGNLFADINEEFINLFVNELPCSPEFIEYIDNDISMRDGFSFMNNDEVKILQEIFQGYCRGVSTEFLSSISQKIFARNITYQELLYAIHSSKFDYHFYGKDPIKISDVLVNELTLVNSVNIIRNENSSNIKNIIANLRDAIYQFALSEFDENLDTKKINYNSYTNTLYASLEKFIFKIIDKNFLKDDLSEIASILFSIRLDKSNNLNHYASPLERLGAREEIIKIYLNNYENGSIKFYEFNKIFNQNNEIVDYDFISIVPTIDNVTDLNTINTSFEFGNFGQDEFTNESDKIFENVATQMLFDMFDDHPEEVIDSLLLRVSNNYKNIDCGLEDKKYLLKDDSLDSKLTALQFLAYQFNCNPNKKIFPLMDDLKIFYQDLRSKKLSKEIINQALFDLSVISMFVDSYILLEWNKLEFNDEELDLFSKKYISLKEEQFKVVKLKPISVSYDQLIPFISLTFAAELITDEYKDSYKKLEEKLIDNISFDIESIKTNLLSKDLSKSDKIFFSQGMNIIGLMLLNSVSEFAPEYFSILINDFEKGIPESRLNKIKDFKSVTSFYLDNINEIFESSSPEFIFTLQPLDKWFVFKDLLSQELLLNYVFSITGLNTVEQYYEENEKRIDQIIALRPDKISLEKFKSSFIEENKNLNFIKAVTEYDRLQNEYRELLESKIILNKDIYGLSNESIGFLEDQYRYKLMSIQNELFKEENIGLLFKHDVIDRNFINSYLDKDEAIIVFLAGRFFSLAVIHKKDYRFMAPLYLSTDGFKEQSKKIKNSFSNPNNKIDLEELTFLEKTFFDMFDKDLNNIKQLYIVADEVFSGFPFHALYNKDKESWLIDNYAISYLSGEKLLPYLDKRKLSKKDRFLGFANPSLNKDNLEKQIDKFFSERGDFDLENISNLYELPDTETEIREISKFFYNSRLFFQEKATEENLYKAIDQPADLVAFATHSVKGMNKYYNDRGLVLTPINSDNFNQDGFLSNQQIKSLIFNNKPTVLMTACNTIDPQYYLSLPYSGLASSFMEAGANGVLLSLWNVNSKSSSELNQGIFKNSNNLYFNEALRNSIINIKNNEQFSHPYYWAPYIYLGR
jgi:CHAT domain-containing protein